MVSSSTYVPVSLVLATLLVCIGQLVRDDPAPTPPPPPPTSDPRAPLIEWESSGDCVGRVSCEAEALQAYRLGKHLLANRRAHVANPYLAFEQFERAQRMLDAGDASALPRSMRDMPALKKELREQLDETFKRSRVNLHILRKQKMHERAARELDKLRAYFPNDRCRYNRWAVVQMRRMKEAGTWPHAP